MFSNLLSAITGAREEPVIELTQLEKSKLLLKQTLTFETSLKAMDFVLDDKPEQGLLLLDQADNQADTVETSTVLARGVIEFLEATLGFEMDEMKKASETLARAEELSLKSKENSEKLNLKSSSSYAPGTLYAVTYTESCLLHALLMIFSESVIETAKALYKLRKVYFMLQEIFENMRKIEEEKKNNSETSEFPFIDLPYELTEEEKNDEEISTYIEMIQEMRNERLKGEHIGNSPSNERFRDELGLAAFKKLSLNNQKKTFSDSINGKQVSTVDEFISSGVSLCYGILQVVLSLIPPAIGAVLSVVGFKSSRIEGLRLLWNATQSRNVHGCISLLGLMLYYDGPYQFTDSDFDIPAKKITPSLENSEKGSEDENEVSDKVQKSNHTTDLNADLSEIDQLDEDTLLNGGKILEQAVLKTRAVFPNSALWLLNEAKLLASNGKLEEAVELMDSIDVTTIQMRQVKALFVFERAITLVHLREFERAAEDLLFLIDVSDWSHALYSFFAGACYLELWRCHELGIEKYDKAEFYKERATELIFKAPEYLGKRTFKQRNLPFDKFVSRKVTQYNQIKDLLSLDEPLDSIANSPVYELSYFYNSFNRMSLKNVNIAKRVITEYRNPAIDAKDKDAELVKNFLVSLVLRRLGDIKEGCDILDVRVLPEFFSLVNGKVVYVKKAEDPWLYPSALYERALFNWKLKGIDGLEEDKEWLTRAINYAGDYELSTRIGMKIKAALGRVEHSLS
ncbi:hypothetical protein TBLA_0D05370 [Henningerozyma blattae CBS 6284]|uniref:Inclusion body clearance protein IML2 n=1 Tax=Henningerozyma blattae (strain ATCC 34711 / CBS 6284 / DSM 70876 / NBRC 10599 / NRRL Y-10934 / UCD 77-7) TaxID=1071380 RepID=I2H3S8_HENB6|nr:hypothetical protein TBLA_0D05370 [Tetrapisispora blattae CBS 6284]CCH61030.1 hypothetical protein TBLA_0D05370 [Tetrapisispora blattae CBS 6284]